MTKTHLIDDRAALELFGRVVAQAQKDLAYKRVQPEDRISAKAFLADIRSNACHTSGPQSGRPNGPHAGTK